MNQELKKIGIAYNSQIPEALELSETISSFLEKRGASIQACGAIYDKDLRQQIKKKEFEVLVVLGGDGTMLRASHLCASARLPIVGINLGSFGFLMELQRDGWEKYLPKILTGDYRIEERMLLQAEHFRNQTSRGSWLVVNDVVVCRGQHVRPIRLDAEVDGYHMGQLRGRWIDSRNTYRFHSLRVSRRWGDFASQPAQYHCCACRAPFIAGSTHHSE